MSLNLGPLAGLIAVVECPFIWSGDGGGVSYKLVVSMLSAFGELSLLVSAAIAWVAMLATQTHTLSRSLTLAHASLLHGVLCKTAAA